MRYIFWAVYLNVLICGCIAYPRFTAPTILLQAHRALSEEYPHSAPSPVVTSAKAAELPVFLRRSLLFLANSAEFSLGAEKRLRRQARWLREHPKAHVLVVGFCDPLGSETCSHLLARHRAERARMRFLKLGVEGSQIVAVKGWEKAEPICRAATEECRQENRRVRIFLTQTIAEDRP